MYRKALTKGYKGDRYMKFSAASSFNVGPVGFMSVLAVAERSASITSKRCDASSEDSIAACQRQKSLRKPKQHGISSVF